MSSIVWQPLAGF